MKEHHHRGGVEIAHYVKLRKAALKLVAAVRAGAPDPSVDAEATAVETAAQEVPEDVDEQGE